MNYMKEFLDMYTAEELETLTDDELEAVLEYIEDFGLEIEYERLIDDILQVVLKRTLLNL